MVDLLECRLDLLGKYCRWTAVFAYKDLISGGATVHHVSVAHQDPEESVKQLGKLIESVCFLFSTEYKRSA